MKKIGVVADIGYTSVELRRILATHPEAELAVITSRNEAGTQVPDLYPSLPRRVTISFSDPAAAELGKCDVVFFARPNGVAMAETPALLKAGVRVVDLAADFRIKDIAEWEKSYGMTHACPDLVAEAYLRPTQDE